MFVLTLHNKILGKNILPQTETTVECLLIIFKQNIVYMFELKIRIRDCNSSQFIRMNFP